MSACFVSDDPMTLGHFHEVATALGFGPYWPSEASGPVYVDEEGNKACGVRHWGNRVFFSCHRTTEAYRLVQAVSMTSDHDDDFFRLHDAASRSARRKGQERATYPAPSTEVSAS
jgi:hypothetical protein